MAMLSQTRGPAASSSYCLQWQSGWLQTGTCSGASADQDGALLMLGAVGRTSLAVTGVFVGFCRSLGLLLQSSGGYGNNCSAGLAIAASAVIWEKAGSLVQPSQLRGGSGTGAFPCC